MSILGHVPQKILFYSDMRLFFHIFFASLRFPASLFPAQKKIFFDRLNNKHQPSFKIVEKEKIARYVSLYFRILGKLGFRNTCLTRSAVLCYILRKYGFPAQINFGIPANQGKCILDPSFLGHCWVDIVGEDFIEEEYETVHKYPLAE